MTITLERVFSNASDWKVKEKEILNDLRLLTKAALVVDIESEFDVVVHVFEANEYSLRWVKCEDNKYVFGKHIRSMTSTIPLNINHWLEIAKQEKEQAKNELY